MCVINIIPLEWSLLLPVHTANSVQTLKAGTKASLDTKLTAEQAARAENDEELRQELARAMERSNRNMQDMVAYGSPTTSPMPARKEFGHMHEAGHEGEGETEDEEDEDEDGDDSEEEDTEAETETESESEYGSPARGINSGDYGSPSPDPPRKPKTFAQPAAEMNASLNDSMPPITEGGDTEDDADEEEEDEDQEGGEDQEELARTSGIDSPARCTGWVSRRFCTRGLRWIARLLGLKPGHACDAISVVAKFMVDVGRITLDRMIAGIEACIQYHAC
jgi:hypothetical protein